MKQFRTLGMCVYVCVYKREITWVKIGYFSLFKVNDYACLFFSPLLFWFVLVCLSWRVSGGKTGKFVFRVHKREKWQWQCSAFLPPISYHCLPGIHIFQGTVSLGDVHVNTYLYTETQYMWFEVTSNGKRQFISTFPQSHYSECANEHNWSFINF